MTNRPRSLIAYGHSGISKTTQNYHIAKYCLQKWPNAVVRLISCDGGGYAPFQDSGMIDRGEVQVFDASASKSSFADIRRLSEGFWPNPKASGEFWSTTAHETKNWDRVSCYIVEGCYSIGKLWLTQMTGTDGAVGFKKAFEFKEDEFNFSGLQEGHYGIAAGELYRVIQYGFNVLPIKLLVFTSHEAVGETKLKVKSVGPAGPGNKIVPEIPSWFQNAFHLQKIIVTEEQKRLFPGMENKAGNERIVAWYETHLDEESGTPNLAKISTLPQLRPLVDRQYPNGWIPLSYSHGIDRYLKFYDSLIDSWKAMQAKKAAEKLEANK